METFTDIKIINQLLSVYKGGNISIELYSSTFKRLTLKLFSKNQEKVLYITSIGSQFVIGKFNWSNVDIHIVEENVNEDKLTKIVDLKANFELISNGGVVVAQGYESEFGNTFDDFLRPTC